MKKAKYKQLKRDSKIYKGNKIKKELKEKSKSVFLGYRKDLQAKPNYDISSSFIMREKETIQANISRRSGLKINQDPVKPKGYYDDCYVNSEEYKNRYKK